MKFLWWCAGVALVAGCTPTAAPQADATADLNGKCDVVRPYDIDFQRFDEAAQQIAHATGCFIEVDTGRYGAIQPRPVRGDYSARQAAALAIEGTTLRIVSQTPDRIVIEGR